MTSFTQATSIHPISPTRYSAHFPPDWCIGSVPNGGYLASTILTAAALHSSTTLSHLRQPHVIGLHLNFLRRTSVGSAEVRFRELKLGRRTSNLGVSLVQREEDDDDYDGGKLQGRECVRGSLILSNLATESGISLPTRWTLSPRPSRPLATVQGDSFFANLLQDKDEHYTEWHDTRFPEFRPAGKHLRMFIPRRLRRISVSKNPSTATSIFHHGDHESDHADEAGKATIDQYITFRPSSSPSPSPSCPPPRFTRAALGYVVDMFPQIVENLYTPSPKAPSGKAFWYPTLTLALDIKTLLPPEGLEWLFVRVQAKSIKNGRMDLDVTVLDPRTGALVATSQHVALIVGSDRNTSGRGAPGEIRKPREAVKL